MNTTTATEPVAEQVDLSDSGIKQFVTFELQDEHFAFPMAEVLEIIRLPQTVNVPLTAQSLIGLANLRGSVLPIIDLNILLGFQANQYGESTRVIVVAVANGRAKVGLIVDKVNQVKNIADELIDTDTNSTSIVDGDLLRGIIRNEQRNEPVTQLIDVTGLIEQDFAGVIHSSRADMQNVIEQSATVEQVDDASQLVSFVCDDQEYAFNLMDVEEIVRVPAKITVVPNTQAHIVGLIELRQRPLPIIDLRYFLGLTQSPLTEAHRIVVASVPDKNGGRNYAGFIVDNVNEVLSVSQALQDDVPPMLNKGSDNEILRICQLEDGKRLVSILNIHAAFGHPSVSSVIAEHQQVTQEQDMDSSDEANAIEGDDTIVQLVVFKLQEQEYGISIEHVQEITRLPEKLDRVPKTADFIDGLFNLRGTVLPVLDMRTRFGLERMASHDRQRILVLCETTTRTGFIVDSVTEVVRIDRSIIEESPPLSEEQTRIMGKVVNLQEQKRIIQVLEISNLLSSDEKQAIDEVK